MAITFPVFPTNPNPGSPGVGGFTPPAGLYDRARAQQPLKEVPQNAPSGSLVIVDSFVDSFEGAAHGNVAAFAAKEHGFRGQIYAENIGPDVPGPTQAQVNDSYGLLSSGSLKPAAARQAVLDLTRHSQRRLLENVTGDLDKIRGRGLKDSAVNVSYGTHPQRQAENIYEQVRSAPTQPIKSGVFGGSFGSIGGMVGGSISDENSNFQFAQNVFAAYDVDPAKFHSKDKAVSGPERLKLQQGLLSAAEESRRAPDVQTAKAAYDKSVRALEANNNSVVVSVGNQGEILDRFASDANGLKVKAGPESGHNILVNSHVTTVGSTRWYNNGTERIAGYNSKDPETDIYASGSVATGPDPNKMGTLGTSFASPRVAGAMAALHGNYPGMPSANIENLMRNRLTHDLQGEKVLDFTLAEEYMRKGTF